MLSTSVFTGAANLFYLRLIVIPYDFQLYYPALSWYVHGYLPYYNLVLKYHIVYPTFTKIMRGVFFMYNTSSLWASQVTATLCIKHIEDNL